MDPRIGVFEAEAMQLDERAREMRSGRLRFLRAPRAWALREEARELREAALQLRLPDHATENVRRSLEEEMQGAGSSGP